MYAAAYGNHRNRGLNASRRETRTANKIRPSCRAVAVAVRCGLHAGISIAGDLASYKLRREKRWTRAGRLRGRRDGLDCAVSGVN